MCLVFAVIFQIALLAALVRVLLALRSPFLCSTIYVGACLIFALLTGVGFENALVVSAIKFAVTSIYFWFLNRYEEQTLIFWSILVPGVFIAFW